MGPPEGRDGTGCSEAPLLVPCEECASREKLLCEWRSGAEGLLRPAGTLPAAEPTSIGGSWETALAGGERTLPPPPPPAPSRKTAVLSFGRASVERNLCWSVLADSEIFLRNGGGCVAELLNGTVLLSSCESPPPGLVVLNGLRTALFPKELPLLGFVRCDRKLTLRRTLEPRSVTLLVKLRRLLSRLCCPSAPRRVLLLLPLLPLFTSEVEVEVRVSPSSWEAVGCAFRFPVSRSTKEGIASPVP